MRTHVNLHMKKCCASDPVMLEDRQSSYMTTAEWLTNMEEFTMTWITTLNFPNKCRRANVFNYYLNLTDAQAT